VQSARGGGGVGQRACGRGKSRLFLVWQESRACSCPGVWAAYTLHPTLYTLHHTPYTLHSTLSLSHAFWACGRPSPYTLHLSLSLSHKPPGVWAAWPARLPRYALWVKG